MDLVAILVCVIVLILSRLHGRMARAHADPTTNLIWMRRSNC